MTILVENLSKKYHIKNSYKVLNSTLKERLTDGVKDLLSWSIGRSSPIEEFWALKELSFSIEQGERIAILGKNGAGKSTLLKILSRITPPTKGRVMIQGRVASLLEVGTGFHPELTGRENIFLSGALLGMSKGDIQKNFEEIVHYSEVEKFLETPVKRYSSGMLVRLGFGVAAHLHPEILIVDEALAVGDAAFKEKCLAKMEEIGKKGVTIIFVSHDMWTLQFCTKGLYLEKGSLVPTNSLEECIRKYQDRSAYA